MTAFLSAEIINDPENFETTFPHACAVCFDSSPQRQIHLVHLSKVAFQKPVSTWEWLFLQPAKEPIILNAKQSKEYKVRHVFILPSAFALWDPRQGQHTSTDISFTFQIHYRTCCAYGCEILTSLQYTSFERNSLYECSQTEQNQQPIKSVNVSYLSTSPETVLFIKYISLCRSLKWRSNAIL